MVIVEEGFYWTIKNMSNGWTLSLTCKPCLLTFFITFKNLQKKKQNQSPKMSEENGRVFIPFANSLPYYEQENLFWHKKWRLCSRNLSSLFNLISLPLSTLSYFVVIPLPFLIKLFTFFRSFPFFLTVSPLFLSQIISYFIFAQYVFSFFFTVALIPSF